jgi:tetratricopeptide (TPR) repeat protein
MAAAVNKEVNAIEKLQAEVAANPKSPEAFANLGWAYYGKGQWQEAAKAFGQALSLSADQLEAHYGLALVHKATGAKMEAIASFERASALAAKLDDHVRNQMLTRQIRGHINLINSGNWNLGKDVVRS